MGRPVFHSFEFDADCQRAAKIRNIGVVEGNEPVSSNEWEAVKRGGDRAVERWINGQLSDCDCTIVLIGESTAGRKWINYEIQQSWALGLGVMGIYIHNVTDLQGYQTYQGDNPFDEFTVDDEPMSEILHAYDPPQTTSKGVYRYIAENIEDWVEEAIAIRAEYP